MPSRLRDILDTVGPGTAVLVADFHSLRQSQRGFIRLLRAVRRVQDARTKVTIALECFRDQDNSSISRYLSGKVSAAFLRRETDFDARWMFPWHHYEMILNMARDLGLSVVGVSPGRLARARETSTLKRRDDHAATVLGSLMAKGPRDIVVCLIGEHHLAPQHLPRSIRDFCRTHHRPAPRVIRVLANVDRYFNEDMLSPMGMHSTEYVRLDLDTFCMLNTPPWIKWKSHALWEELEYGRMSPNDLDVEGELASMGCALLEFVGVSLDHKKHLGHWRVSARQGREIACLRGPEFLNRRRRLALDGFVCDRAEGTVYFRELNVNHLAEAAGQLLVASGGVQAGRREQEYEGPQVRRFVQRMVQYIGGMAGLKILNPRRKSRPLGYYRTQAEHDDMAQSVIQLLGALDSTTRPWRRDRLLEEVARQDLDHGFGVSHAVGSLLGDALVRGLVGDCEGLRLLVRLWTSQSEESELLSDIYRYCRGLL